tara:strand:- start:988 stop:1200 length:213 start_codon:yes stop_codon:yes gene_type:complete
MSSPKQPPAPIQQVPQRVVSQAVEAIDKPIELITADKDIKKKKKKAIADGTAQLQTTGLAYNTSNTGVKP